MRSTVPLCNFLILVSFLFSGIPAQVAAINPTDEGTEEKLYGSVYFEGFQTAPHDWFSEEGDPLLDMQTAWDVVEELNSGGYADWRIPEDHELLIMFEERRRLPGIAVPGFYWSASGLSAGYRIIDFFSGYQDESRPGDLHRLRPVRSLGRPKEYQY